ncbi:MAG: 6-hydroxycyclohex-1-ene-1-carbonyl-CoA dehydrogenase [Acidobacteria bacterium]|nr:6-hydroxycyclohex-1-ene-1-carbonyl-CoA dehydrogenase [Acidobacteriota bacterium]
MEVAELQLADPLSGEALIGVAGCGLCHTDISFYSGAVRTRRPLPLVLGHEIAGVVLDAPPPFAHLTGREVIVPAVIPCDACDLCREGRDNACAAQIMPGNHVHGGFASHVVVPARHLVVVPDHHEYWLAELAVVADAVTTPYQALKRAGVERGDLVIVIGVGGIGLYAVQIAAALGASVAAIDVARVKLDRLEPFAVRWRFNAREQDAGAIKKTLVAESGVTTARWRILEMSGTAAGQECAWSLLGPASTLGVIGFTMDKPNIRLSNLMALDASAFGSWGCSPRHYPAALDLVLTGKVNVKPFVELRPLTDAPELFAALTEGHDGHHARFVLVPSHP